METPRNLDRLFGRLAEALKGTARKLRREKPPAMIGLPPSARGLKAIPDDIEEHAKDFAARYWEPLEAIARKRMREVGVPEDRIGMLDTDNDFRLAAFHPHRTVGGEVHHQTGRIAYNKPEAQAKGIERYAFSNALRLRFRLVSPVPAYSDEKSGAPIQRCSTIQVRGGGRRKSAQTGMPSKIRPLPARACTRLCGSTSMLPRSRTAAAT